jgi:hypothetical protein
VPLEVHSMATTKRFYPTAKAAGDVGFSQWTLLSYHGKHGHFKGVTPVKGPNGRLQWPADEIDALAASNPFASKGGAA